MLDLYIARLISDKLFQQPCSQSGLFPSALVETIPGKLHQIGSEDEGAHHSRPNAYGVGTSDDDTDLNRKPLSPHRGPFFADFSDIGSIASSGREDEDSDLVRQRPNADDDIDSKWANFTPPPLPMRRRSTTTDMNGRFHDAVILDLRRVEEASSATTPTTSSVDNGCHHDPAYTWA